MPSDAMLEAAQEIHRRGWAPVPTVLGDKKPVLEDWPAFRPSYEELPQHFGDGRCGIGVILGGPSGGLTDVDLDCPEALLVASLLLPSTSTFGRRSKPQSHYLYISPSSVTHQFRDPVTRTMLVELRSTGGQTVFPPTTHPSGEAIVFETDGVPTVVDAEVLLEAVRRVAAAALLVRYGFAPTAAVELVTAWEPGADDGLPEPVAVRVREWLGLGAQRATPAARQVAPSYTATVEQRVRRASAYLAKMPPAVSGEGGHAATWDAACVLVRGFDLPSEVALDLLKREYNPRCKPEWSEKDLDHKVASAAAKGRLPIGYLLEEHAAHAAQATSAHVSADATAPDDDDLDEASDDDEPAAPPLRKRPVILATTEESEVIDKALAALAGRPDLNLYHRGGALVHVLAEAPGAGAAWHGPLAPRIALMLGPRLRELLSLSAQWLKEKRDSSVAAHPPSWAVQGVLARGMWPPLRKLEAVVEHPILRPDGTILDRPGYDVATGILYQPSLRFLAVPTQPTAAEISGSVDLLLEVVCDFPFETGPHRSAWLAALLTPLARFAFHGPAPLTLIDANVRGSGKTMLADIIALILYGRSAPRMASAEDDAEMRKKITTVAMAGTLLMLIDNLPGILTGASLDAALTGTTWTDRILSTNTEFCGPLLATWIATGNNVVLGGDLSRRCVHVRLLSQEEQPELRSEFKHPNLITWVRTERPRLLAAALTLLRGYCAAGRPERRLPSWGSFEGWSQVVRQSLVWAGQPDPGDTREELVAVADQTAVALQSLLRGLEELGREFGGTFRVTDVLTELERQTSPPRHVELREALLELCPAPPGKPPSARSVGRLFTRFRDRVAGGRALVRASEEKTNSGFRWAVRPTTGG